MKHERDKSFSPSETLIEMKNKITFFFFALASLLLVSCSKSHAYYESKSREFINIYNANGNLTEKEWHDAIKLYDSYLEKLGKDIKEARSKTDDYLAYQNAITAIDNSYAECRQLGFLLNLKKDSLSAEEQEKINKAQENLNNIKKELEASFIQNAN